MTTQNTFLNQSREELSKNRLKLKGMTDHAIECVLDYVALGLTMTESVQMVEQ